VKVQLKQRWLNRCLILLIACQSGVASAQISETELRTAFVYNFLKFIQWPHTPKGDLRLCVIAAEEHARQSLTQVEYKPIHGRNVDVIFLDDAKTIATQLNLCHMIYVPTSGIHIPLPHLLPKGLVLVKDDPLTNDHQVAIALVRSPNDNIEFWINDKAITQAGVLVSSQLMKLAKNQRNRVKK
jgi:hypothetical protein